MSVAALVIENGGNEDQAIGALLHDAAEDQGGRVNGKPICFDENLTGPRIRHWLRIHGPVFRRWHALWVAGEKPSTVYYVRHRFAHCSGPEVYCRPCVLSIRSWVTEAQGRRRGREGVGIGEVMQGGGVGEVVASNHPAWKIAAVGPRLDSRFRIMARRDAAGVRLITRKGNDLTQRFPFIAMAVAALPVPSCLIDGEAIVSDDDGLAIFDRIRGYGTIAGAALCAFDLWPGLASRASWSPQAGAR